MSDGERIPDHPAAQAWRISAAGLIGLALLLAYFAGQTPDALPAIRLRQTRTNFFLHLACNAAFLVALYGRLQSGRRPGPRIPGALTLIFLGCAALAALSSPIRASAIERFAVWLDATLLFFAAAWTFGGRARFFLVLLFSLGGFLAVADAAVSLAAKRPLVSPEWVLAAGGAIIAFAAWRLTESPSRSPSSGAREAALLLPIVAAVIALDWMLSNPVADTSTLRAARLLMEANAFFGGGLGIVPEILPAFGSGDFERLPPPSMDLMALRVEMGWLGATLLGLMALASLRAVCRASMGPGDRRPNTVRVGLTGLLAFILADFLHRPSALHPFGAALCFLVMGVMNGPGPSSGPALPASPRRRMEPAAWGAFLGAFVVLALIARWEAKPWRAARLARLTDAASIESPEYGARILRAAHVFPHEAAHWDMLAAHRREILSARPFTEELFQDVIEAYERAIKANPYRYKLHYSHALTYYMAKRLPEAVQALDNGLRYLPHSTPLRRWLIKARFEIGDLAGALGELRLLERAIPPTLSGAGDRPERLNPEWVEIHFRMAETHEAMGDLHGALAQYAMARRKDPDGAFGARAKAEQEKIKERLLAAEP